MSKYKEDDCCFDEFHNYKVCDIPATQPKRVDPLKAYRPRGFPQTNVKHYELEQAYTILDRDPVKVHYTDTSGKYTFHPRGFTGEPVARRNHGRGPLERELMEEFADIIAYYQYQAHVKLREIMILKAKHKREAQIKLERRFAQAAGPDWFQELSNLQIEAIDSLGDAIVKDLRNNTIEHTQFVIGRLGLVLRPHHIVVKLALNWCASCPVEFLLVLYQLINPDRVNYSVNDRLLLSAVMHLTIRSTLRELHIRIPSPPREPKPKKERPKPKPKQDISSPYLQILNRANLTPKQSFILPNKFYPSNPYFDYKKQLECEQIFISTLPEGDTTHDFQFDKIFHPGICTCKYCESPNCAALKESNEFVRVELEIVTEWTKAQKYYLSLSREDQIPILGKASVYVCPLGIFRPHARSESITNLIALQRSISKRTTTSKPPDNTSETLSSIKFNPTITCGCITSDEVSSAPDDIPFSNLKGKLKKKQDEYDTAKELDPITTTSRLIAQLEAEYHCICSLDEATEGEEEPPPPIHPPCTVRDYEVGRVLTVKTVESQTCACKEAILKRIEESLCPCERCVEDRRRANSIVKYIITDTKETEDKPIPIIRDCQAKAICTCMEKYKKRWEKFERQRGIRKVQEAIKSLDEKFVINGTAVGPDGKIVYIISSVQPKVCCQCSKIKEMEKEQKETLKKMPMPPGGCIKYHISGVQERPEGNVYIVAGTTENTECDCMQLYERFTREHSICLKLYEEYLKKIAFDVEEYMNELDPKYDDFEPAATWTGDEVVVMPKTCKCHTDRTTQMTPRYCRCEDTTSESSTKETGECVCSVKSCPCGLDSCECITEEGRSTDDSLFGIAECPCSFTTLSVQQGVENTDNCSCSKFDDRKADPKFSDSITNPGSSKGNTYTQSSSKKDTTTTAKIKSNPFAMGNDMDISESLQKFKDSYATNPLYKFEDPPVLDRYIILKSLPKTHKHQQVILKKALEKLAEDGFPLARLPEVHRLPIFRCWWRYRLEQYRTAKYRTSMLQEDIRSLVRMELQRELPPTPNRNYLRKRPDLATMDNHDKIKKHNMEMRSQYYRDAKVVSINNARKMFTGMATYEFYTKTFRDVFFAYMPSKDEDIILDQIWKSGEYISHHTAKSCL